MKLPPETGAVAVESFAVVVCGGDVLAELREPAGNEVDAGGFQNSNCVASDMLHVPIDGSPRKVLP